MDKNKRIGNYTPQTRRNQRYQSEPRSINIININKQLLEGKVPSRKFKRRVRSKSRHGYRQTKSPIVFVENPQFKVQPLTAQSKKRKMIKRYYEANNFLTRGKDQLNLRDSERNWLSEFNIVIPKGKRMNKWKHKQQMKSGNFKDKFSSLKKNLQKPSTSMGHYRNKVAQSSQYLEGHRQQILRQIQQIDPSLIPPKVIKSQKRKFKLTQYKNSIRQLEKQIRDLQNPHDIKNLHLKIISHQQSYIIDLEAKLTSISKKKHFLKEKYQYLREIYKKDVGKLLPEFEETIKQYQTKIQQLLFYIQFIKAYRRPIPLTQTTVQSFIISSSSTAKRYSASKKSSAKKHLQQGKQKEKLTFEGKTYCVMDSQNYSDEEKCRKVICLQKHQDEMSKLRDQHKEKVAKLSQKIKELSKQVNIQTQLIKRYEKVVDENQEENNALSKKISEQKNSDDKITLFFFADCYNALSLPNAYQVMRWRGNENTLVIGGGDYFSGGALSQIDKGTIMLEALYDMNVKVSAIGNHEFDHGVKRILTLLKQSQDKIKWICSNLYVKKKLKKKVIKKYPDINIKDIVIHEDLIVILKGKKIGLFGLLDKNTKKKMSDQNRKDFLEVFTLEENIREVSERCVRNLKAKGAEFIIAIANMDGYYSTKELMSIPFSKRDSNTLSCVVEGVDLVLDACNQDNLAGKISRDQFKGADGLEIKGKLPGYVKGGVDLDYLFEIVLNDQDLSSDMTFYMHNTQTFPPNESIYTKYTDLVQKYLAQTGFKLHTVALHTGFDLSYYRFSQEGNLAEIIFNAVKEIQDNLDLLILPAGLIRSLKKYSAGNNFTTYDLKSIFAFGCNLIFFEMSKQMLKLFKERFSQHTGKGSYPQFYPVTLIILNDPMICATSAHHFEGADDYPFQYCQKVRDKPFDLLNYMNNQNNLSHFLCKK